MSGQKVIGLMRFMLIGLVCFGTIAVADEAPATTSDAPARFGAEVFFDLGAPELHPVIPGLLEFRHWQSMVSTAVMMRFTAGAEGHVPTIAGQYGGIHLHLIEGALKVEFPDQSLTMKSGDVAAWGHLQHRIACESEECLVFIMADPGLWQELGPNDSNPVPLYIDPAYYSAQGRKQ